MVLDAYANSDDTTIVATATSDASGKFSLVIDQASLDGYVKLTKSGYTDTYSYPEAPWTASGTLEADLIASDLLGLLVTFGGGDSSEGVVIATVQDKSAAAVSGATISSSPASGVYRYSASNMEPTSTTSTASDGTGFFFNTPSSAMTVTATKSGATFGSHSVTARANALTITTISEQ